MEDLERIDDTNHMMVDNFSKNIYNFIIMSLSYIYRNHLI